MGFGCNAVGVVGCRIIDSKRERLIAMLTNSLIPCNGRFPTLIALISLFLVTAGGFMGSALSALALSGVIIVSIFATLLLSWILSKTLLRGTPSSFTLELPPYRRPEIGKVIVRSALDRTVFVLGRSLAFAAPAGLLLWLSANINIGGASVASYGARILEPIGYALGMDGVILLAFLLALPANEIFLPVALMVYGSGSALEEYSNLSELFSVLSANGWTWLTAVCVIIFTLFHFPCATTVMTVKKESGSFWYAFLAAVLPTALGATLCFIIALFARAF